MGAATASDFFPVCFAAGGLKLSISVISLLGNKVTTTSSVVSLNLITYYWFMQKVNSLPYEYVNGIWVETDMIRSATVTMKVKVNSNDFGLEKHHHHHHWAAVVPGGWAKGATCRLQLSFNNNNVLFRIIPNMIRRLLNVLIHQLGGGGSPHRFAKYRTCSVYNLAPPKTWYITWKNVSPSPSLSLHTES